MKKVSFSLSSSSKPSNPTINPSPDQQQHDSPSNKQFITGFDSSQTPTQSTSINPITIPPLPNQWNPTTNPPQQPDNPNNNINTNPVSAIDRLMLIKLKNDLKTLPDDKGFEDFNDVPVEEFASAYLKAYGWSEGRGIGKNVKEDVKVAQFRNYASGQGLGFVRTESVERE